MWSAKAKFRDFHKIQVILRSKNHPLTAPKIFAKFMKMAQTDRARGSTLVQARFGRVKSAFARHDFVIFAGHKIAGAKMRLAGRSRAKTAEIVDFRGNPRKSDQILEESVRFSRIWSNSWRIWSDSGIWPDSRGIWPDSWRIWSDSPDSRESDQILENLVFRFSRIWKTLQSFSFSRALYGAWKRKTWANFLAKSWKTNFWSKKNDQKVDQWTSFFDQKSVFNFLTKKLAPNFLTKKLSASSRVCAIRRRKMFKMNIFARNPAMRDRKSRFSAILRSAKNFSVENRRKWSLTPSNFRPFLPRISAADFVWTAHMRPRKSGSDSRGRKSLHDFA